MAFNAKSKTQVRAEGNRFQARYYDPEMRLWFDLGDPRDTYEDALALASEMKEQVSKQ